MRERVKCAAGLLRGVARALASLGLGAAGVAVAELVAHPAAAQLLYNPGPSAPRPLPPLDEGLPPGVEQVARGRPKLGLGALAACSFRWPVCVHPPIGQGEESHPREWLAALEAAYLSLVPALDLPGPLPDGARGGSGALDLYLRRDAEGVRVELDAPDPGASVDTASAFCLVGEGELPRERAATICVAEAIAARLDAAETPFSRRALATELWLATGAPSSADAAAIDDVQAHPERAIVARDRSPHAEGSALFLDYLDAAKGRGGPAGMALATYALATRTRSPALFRFINEPDTMDVLRTTFGPTPSDFARLLADFTVARALAGSRDAEGAWPTMAWAGDLARVRFEWSVPFSSLPRQLAPARPIDPTGATYLWVTLDQESGPADLVFTAEWEPPVAFRWAIVALAADGHVVRRIDVPFVERDTRAQRVVSELSGAAALIIAGTQLGGLGPSYPFDPDFEPFEPHGYTVYLAKQ